MEYHYTVVVAQLVEQRNVNPNVVSSSLISHPILSVRLMAGQEPLKLLIVVRVHDWEPLPQWWNGRHNGLKTRSPESVQVQFLSEAPYIDKLEMRKNYRYVRRCLPVQISQSRKLKSRKSEQYCRGFESPLVFHTCQDRVLVNSARS